MTGSGLATRHAPSWRLIQAHFGLGVVGLLAFTAVLALRADELEGFFFQPLLLALVHLCILGWLLPTAIGALHQLVPVVFEVPVRSERLSWCALVAYALGAPVLIASFFTFDPAEPAGFWLPAGATLAAAAVWLYAANLLATLARSRARTLTGVHVIAALLYLVVAVALGALMAWNLSVPFLPVAHIEVLRAHAHVAGLGFFGLLIMGVAYRLLEMFLVSHGAGERAGWTGFFAINAAVLLLTASFLGGGDWPLRAGVGAAALGVGAFVVQVRAIFRRRVRRAVDTSWHHTATSLGYLALALLASGALALAPIQAPWWDRLHLAYGLLAIPGFIGTIVVGQLYKIVPFLIWLHHFSPLVGLRKVPGAAELLPELPKRIQYLLMHAGMAALVCGVLAGSAPLRIAGAATFGLSMLVFVRNLGVIQARRP